MSIGARSRSVIYDNADYFFWQTFEWTKEGRDASTQIALNLLQDQVADEQLRKALTPD